MSDPTLPPPPPQPFAQAPKPSSSGCGRGALVGCGVLLLLLGVAAVLFVVKAKSLLGWSMNKMKDEIVRKLPADVTPAERERLENAFAAASAKATEGEIDPAALQRLQRELVSLTQGELTREKVLQVTRELESIGGIASPDDGSEGETDVGVPDAEPAEAAPAAPLAAWPPPVELLAA